VVTRLQQAQDKGVRNCASEINRDGAEAAQALELYSPALGWETGGMRE
jgi:hypothetical protein